MLVAQNSLGPVCPVPLTVRGTEDVPLDAGRGRRPDAAFVRRPHRCLHGLAGRAGRRLEAGPARLRPGGARHADGTACAFSAAAVEEIITPRGVVAAALAAQAAPKPVDGDCLVAGQLDRAHAYARWALALANLARVAAVEDTTATDGVLPAQGLGGGRRRRRGLSNGVVGGVIAPLSYEMSSCKARDASGL